MAEIPPANRPVHDAFISYSRKDKQFAALLKKALEGYKPPRDLKVPQRTLDIFRDETDFTGVEYEQSIEKHLGESARLLVICSPNACRSRYVPGEIQIFARLKGPENIIPILLSGIPNNEVQSGQEDQRAFPGTLCEVMPMPLAEDYRQFDPGRHKINRSPFTSAWFKLLADIYGISRREVEERDHKRRIRRLWVTTGIVTAIFTVLLAALIVALIERRTAVVERQNAVVARDDAEKQRAAAERQAQGRRLAAQAAKLTGSPTKPPAVGVLLAIESLRQYPTLEGDSALRQGLVMMPRKAGKPVAVREGDLAILNRDGSWLLVAGTNLSVNVYNCKTSDQIASLVQTSQIHALVLSRDDRYLGIASDAGAGIWQDWHSSAPKEAFHIAGPANSLAFSPRGDYLAVGGVGESNNVNVFVVRDPSLPVATLSHLDHSGTNAVDGVWFGDNEKFLLSRTQPDDSGSQSNSVSVWDWGPRTLLSRLPPSETAPMFDGETLLLKTGNNQGIQAWEKWDSTNPSPLRDYHLADEIIAISPDGRLAVTRRGISTLFTTEETPKVLQVWDGWKTDKPVEIGRLYGSEQISFSSDGEFYVARSRKNFQVYQTTGHERVIGIDGVNADSFRGGPYCRFSRDGKYLGAVSDGLLRIFEVATGREIFRRTGQRTFAFSPDAGRLALSDSSIMTSIRSPKTRILDKWRDQKPAEIATINVADAQALAFTPDAGSLLTMTNGSLELWNLPALDVHLIARMSTNMIETPPDASGLTTLHVDRPGGGDGIITFDPTGQYLLATVADHVQVWENWRSGPPKEIANRTMAESAHAFADDGGSFATVLQDESRSQSIAQIFRLIGKPSVARIPFYDLVYDVALGPDGSRLAIGSSGTVELWDVARAEKTTSAWVGGVAVATVVFSPNGKYLAAWAPGSDGNGSLNVLLVNPDDLIEEAHTRLSRNLTPTEWTNYVGGGIEFHKTFADLP